MGYTFQTKIHPFVSKKFTSHLLFFNVLLLNVLWTHPASMTSSIENISH